MILEEFFPVKPLVFKSLIKVVFQDQGQILLSVVLILLVVEINHYSLLMVFLLVVKLTLKDLFKVEIMVRLDS